MWVLQSTKRLKQNVDIPFFFFTCLCEHDNRQIGWKAAWIMINLVFFGFIWAPGKRESVEEERPPAVLKINQAASVMWVLIKASYSGNVFGELRALGRRWRCCIYELFPGSLRPPRPSSPTSVIACLFPCQNCLLLNGPRISFCWIKCPAPIIECRGLTWEGGNLFLSCPV